MNSEPSTSSEEPDEYKRISAWSQSELTLMGNLEDVDVPPDLFEKAKKACIERIGAILEFSKGGPLGGDESSGIHVLNEKQLRQVEEWQNDNFSREASEGPDESSIVEPLEASGRSEASEDNIGSLDSAGSSEGKGERQTEPEVVPGSQGSEAIFPGPENQEPALPIPAKRRPGRPKKEKNLNLDFIEPMDLEIPATLVTNGTNNSQKFPAKPAEASEAPAEPALAEQAPKPAYKLPVKEKIVEKEIEDQAGTSGPSDKLVEQGNSQKEEKVDQKMDHGSSQRKKKQKTEYEKLREMDFGPKAGGSLRDIEDRSSREKQWTKQVLLEQGKKLEGPMDHPKLSISNRVARKSKDLEPSVSFTTSDAPKFKESNDLEPAVLSETSDFPVMDITVGSEVSGQLVNLNGPESMDLDLDALNSTFEASIASDSPVEETLVNLDPPNSTSITSSSPVKDLPDDSDPLVDLEESEAIPEVSSFANRRSTVPENPEPLVKPKDDPPELPIRVATLKTKRNVLLDVPNYSKRAKVHVSSIVESSDAHGPSEASEDNIGNLHSAEKAHPESSNDRSETQTKTEAVPGSKGSEDLELKNQEPVLPIPVKRHPGRPRKEKNLNLEDKEPEVKEPEIPATPTTNDIDNSRKSPAKPAEASEPAAESAPAPKPAYGPSTIIKEIPEWIRKYQVHEEDLPKHGRPWIFSPNHYRPGGPKAPDPRLKLREQAIEEYRKKRGYDKLPVKEKAVEKEKEDQAGTSGSSDKLVEQGNSQKKMDQGSEDQESEVSVKRRPGRPRKGQNQNSADLEPLDLEIPATPVTNGTHNSQKSPAKPAEASEVPGESAAAEPAPKPASGAEKRVEEEIEDQSGTSECSQRKKKQKNEVEKLRAMDFGPKAGGSLKDIEDRSSREKQWTKKVQLEQGKQLEESMDLPKLSMSNRVARKSKDLEPSVSFTASDAPKLKESNDLEPAVLSRASNSLVKDLPERSGDSDQLVNLDGPESMDLDLDAPNSTFEASIASDSPVEKPLVNVDAPNMTHIAYSSPVKDLPEDSDPLVDLDKSQTIPEVPSFTNRRSTVQEDPESLAKSATPKDDPPELPIRVATLKTKRNVLLDIPNPSKRAKVQVSSIVESSDAPGPLKASEDNIGNLDSGEEAPLGSSDDRSDLQETQTESEAVPGYQGSKTVSVDRVVQMPTIQRPENQGSEAQGPKDQETALPIPVKRRPGRPRKEKNQNLEDKEPEAREPEIPATPTTNDIDNSKHASAKQAEAPEPPAEPAPKPAYGPSTKIKEIPEWIRKYQVHEEDLPRHGKPWLFSLDHYRPGGPKAPDPRLKLREQDIEKIRRKCGYDKLPVKEKRLEKEIEGQAGTSGPSDKLVEQGNSQRKMDQGSEDQGSEISAKGRPGRSRKEQNLNSADLEPLDLVTDGTDSSQKFQAKPAEASEAPAEPAAAKPSPKPAEKRVEKNIEDQAGTSECSQRKKKLKTEVEKLRAMDFGPKAGGSLQDIEDISSREKQWTKKVQLEQGKQLEESMDLPKLSMSNRAARKSKDLKPSVSFTASDDPKFKESNDLEPAVSSGASNSQVKDLPGGSEVSDQLVDLDGPVSMDLDLYAPNSTSDTSMASNSPVAEPLVNMDAPNTISMAPSSSVMDLPEDSDPLVELDKSQTISEVPNSTSAAQKGSESLAKSATPKDDPVDSPIQVAILKSKRNALPDSSNPSKRAKALVPSIVESSDAPGPSEASEDNIGNLDSAGSSEGKEMTQTEEVVPGSQGSKTAQVERSVIPKRTGNQGSEGLRRNYQGREAQGPQNQGPKDQGPENQEPSILMLTKRRPGRPRKEEILDLEDDEPEARDPDVIEPVDLETLPTWNGMDNSFPDFDEPDVVSSIVKPSVVKNRNTAGSKGSQKTVPCSSKASEGRSEVQAGPKPVQGSKTMLVDQRSKDQGSVVPMPAKRRPGRPRKEQNLNLVDKEPEPEFRVPVDMPATRITKLTSPVTREVPKTRVTRRLSLPPRIDTPDLDDTQRHAPSTSQQGPSRGVTSKPQTKWRRNAIIRTVKTSRRKKASEAVENSESDNDDVEGEKPVCKWNSCGAVFSKNKKFYKHVKTHVHGDKTTRRNVDDGPTELYKCRWAGCTRTEPFHSYKKMVHHMREHTNEKPNRGGRPRGSFKTDSHRKKAPEAVEDSESEDVDVEEEKPECKWNSCGKVFTKNERFYEHVKNHVRKDELRNPTGFYKCRWAGCYRTEPFDEYYKLRYHMRRHTGEKPFKCETCGRRFVRQEGLKNHMRTHTGEKPYKCKVCETTFTTSSDRYSHSKKVHGNVRDFICRVPGCNNAYTDPSSLRKHVFKKHPEKEEEFRQGRFRRRNNKAS